VFTFSKYFFIKRGGHELFMLSVASGLARSEHACCLGQHGEWPPVVQGGAERHHLLSGSKLKTFLNQTQYKRCTKIKCSNVVRVNNE